MTYDPFARGRHPVGVRSSEVHDASRADRRVDCELWYPSAPAHAGHDLSPERQDRYTHFGAAWSQEAVRDASPAVGAFPLVIFSHGMASHRRQSSFFCVHLASHGYVVVSPDHGGNTIADLMALALRVRAQELPSDVATMVEGYVFDRPRDLALIIDALTERTSPMRAGLPDVDVSRLAVTGHSFGGFTALVVAARDPRVKAVVAMAPAGGAGPLGAPALTRQLELDFRGRAVDTLYLAVERDTLLPVDGIEAMFRRTTPRARMFTLPDADHMHFCDRAEASHEFFRSMPRLGIFGDIMASIPAFSELVPGAHGATFANALGLAQLDASLKQDAAAEAFLADHAVQAFGERGIVICQR
jgi:predicted dienelactone hydrolase